MRSARQIIEVRSNTNSFIADLDLELTMSGLVYFTFYAQSQYVMYQIRGAGTPLSRLRANALCPEPTIETPC